MRRSVSITTVQADYRAVKALMPNIGTLSRDDFYKTWWINRQQIGETSREASAYLRGLRSGLLCAGFSTKNVAS